MSATSSVSARCKLGRITVAGDFVTITPLFGSGREQSIPCNQITRVERRPGSVGFFGLGASIRLALYTNDGRKIDLGLCAPKRDALAVMAAIQHR